MLVARENKILGKFQNRHVTWRIERACTARGTQPAVDRSAKGSRRVQPREMSAVKLHSPGKTIGSPVMADPLTSEYVQGSYIIRAPPDRAPRREVLKWLQGLDLSHSVRNVRRDAANGYVVAEICSRYFPSDINMHSFENGASLKVKANNWDALVRFCRRAAPGVRLERETAEGCMRMTPGFALELIEKMYTAFTRKTLAPAAPVLAPEGSERPQARIARRAPPRGGRAGERGRRTRGRRRDGARLGLGSVRRRRRAITRTARRARELGDERGFAEGVELRVAGSARGGAAPADAEGEERAAARRALRGDPDAAAGDRGESAREAGDGGTALRREAERQGEKGGQGVRRRREEVTGVDFAIRARRSSLQRTIRSLSMVAD